MSSHTIFTNLGLIPYSEALDFQQKLFDELIHLKILNESLPQCEKLASYNHLIFCEHPHVYTLGKSGDESNLLIDAIQLKANNADFVKTNRGGDITYHGPGQLVGYPILDLEDMQLGTRQYIEKMEEAIIQTLGDYGIISYKKNDAIGVWLAANENESERKIAAIGVKISRAVSMHGFALNVNTNLDYFNYINPCGFIDKGVTSIEKEIGFTPDYEVLKMKIKQNLAKKLSLSFYEMS
jgi:lipoyl(octanoyl) transferase